MQHRCRGRGQPRIRASLAAAWLAASCGSPGPADAPSATEPKFAPRAADGFRAAERRERWALLDEVLGWPLVTSRYPSRGHAPPRYLAEVRAEPLFTDAYRTSARGTPLPVGTRLAVRHFDKAGNAPGPLYFMEKTGISWKFTAVHPDGHVDAHADLTLCARCHADAPNDYVFGPRVREGPPDSDIDQE